MLIRFKWGSLVGLERQNFTIIREKGKNESFNLGEDACYCSSRSSSSLHLTWRKKVLDGLEGIASFPREKHFQPTQVRVEMSLKTELSQKKKKS